VFPQVVLCFVPGTLDAGLSAELVHAWYGVPVPLKPQANIKLDPATGGAPWVSIDLVIPVAQGAAAVVLGTAVIEGVKRIVRVLRPHFPGVNVRVLSDQHPTATYELPRTNEVDAAITAIPQDYRRQSRMELTLKRWSHGRWEVRLLRSASEELAAPKQAIAVGQAKAVRASSARMRVRKGAADRAVVQAARQLEGSIREAVHASRLALSEIDGLMQQYETLRSQSTTRADRRAIDASSTRSRALRDTVARRVLQRWGRDLRMHEGIDIGIPVGTQIFAARGGRVVEVGVHGYGPHSLKVRCGDVDIILGHLSGAVVGRGDDVSEGQLLGYSGDEGGVTGGPHLHFEVRPAGGEYGDTLDPWPYLSAADQAAEQTEEYKTELET